MQELLLRSLDIVVFVCNRMSLDAPDKYYLKEAYL